MTDPTQRADLEPGALAAQRPAARARRRTLLQAAGLVTLAGGGTAVLAACSSGSTTSGTPATSAPGSPSAVASSSAPSGSTSKSAATTPSGPSVAESSVPEGSGVIMSDADYVVTQPSKGEFKAFSKICTHQGCVVADVSTTIDCMCHGSRFSITDGSVVNGPANAPLAESKTTVSGGNVYVEG